MARCYYIPEREKLEPRFGKGDPDFKYKGEPISDTVDESDGWEFQSVDRFIQFLTEEDRETFTTAELVTLATKLGVYNKTLRFMLEEHGFTLQGPVREKNFATFGTNQHDRFTNPEARRMNGGGGGDSIIGFAGRVG